MIIDDDLPGAIFWADSADSVGQEDLGVHPWIVISEPRLARNERLVIAVPMTSNAMTYYDTEVQVQKPEITIRGNVAKQLSPDKLDGWIKCAKVRHWSVDRVGEVIGRASPILVHQIRVVLADILNVPTFGGSAPKRGRKKGRR